MVCRFLEKFLKNNVMTLKVYYDDIVIAEFSQKASQVTFWYIVGNNSNCIRFHNRSARSWIEAYKALLFVR